MIKHKKIDKRERGMIARYLAQGKKLREIARMLCRSPSTISEEVKRNQVWSEKGFVYEAIQAQEECEVRKSKAGERIPLKNTWVYKYVMKHLSCGWTPEQISGRLKRNHPLISSRRIGVETIYRYIYDPKNKENMLPEALPIQEQEGQKVLTGQSPEALKFQKILEKNTD